MSSHRNHAWISTISWLWHFIHSKDENEDIDESLYWLDPIACNSMTNSHRPPKAPKISDDFITKLAALCDALEFYAPNNREVNHLLEHSMELKNDISLMQHDQKEFCDNILLDTYQELIEVQTDYITHTKNCLENIAKVKRSLPDDLANTMREYFSVFETKPIHIHKKH